MYCFRLTSGSKYLSFENTESRANDRYFSIVLTQEEAQKFASIPEALTALQSYCVEKRSIPGSITLVRLTPPHQPVTYTEEEVV